MSHAKLVDNVRRYYDRQTGAFLALGQGGQEGSIHRAVWAPGVSDRQQAFHYVEDRIATLIRQYIDVHGRDPSQSGGRATSQSGGRDPSGSPTENRLHVVDLGCGVASSLCYLAKLLPIQATGITLSPVQARLG